MANKVRFAIDNSLDRLNLALSGPSGLLAETSIKELRSPSQILPEKTLEILGKHGLRVDDITELFVTLGPGSFTGIRVALAFCKGIRAATGLSIHGIPTLDALAFQFLDTHGSYLCPVIDAKKSEIFSALYHVDNGVLSRLTAYVTIKPADIAQFIQQPCILFGSGLSLCQKYLSSEAGVTFRQGFENIKGRHLLDDRLINLNHQQSRKLQPIYGRRSEAEIKFSISID